MDDSMYLIIKDIPTLKQIIRDKFPAIGDKIKWLIGEIQTHHIFRNGFPITKTGNMVIKIPRTLKAWQTKILNSQYASKLKTKAEIHDFLPDEAI